MNPLCVISIESTDPERPYTSQIAEIAVFLLNGDAKQDYLISSHIISIPDPLSTI